MNNLLKVLSLVLCLLLLFMPACEAFAEEEEEIDLSSGEPKEIEEWEDLPEGPGDTSLAADVFYHTPNEHSAVKCDHEVCFWKMEMGYMDEEAIWKVLTRPVTVIEGKQREQVRVLARPEEGCTDYVGVVTCASQAVHVLERGETWSLIEAYSSSEEGSAAAAGASAVTLAAAMTSAAGFFSCWTTASATASGPSLLWITPTIVVLGSATSPMISSTDLPS